MVSVTPKYQELISLLQVNARESVSALARKLGLSRTTVQDRLRRLEQSGVIVGYQLRLSDNTQQNGIRAFVTIRVEPKRANEVARALLKMPQVQSLHSVSGKYDLVALVRTSSAQDMDRLLDLAGLIPGVSGTESAVILSTKVDKR
jgi:DNA-binding Lrp family transcriptional regulator